QPTAGAVVWLDDARRSGGPVLAEDVVQQRAQDAVGEGAHGRLVLRATVAHGAPPGGLLPATPSQMMPAATVCAVVGLRCSWLSVVRSLGRPAPWFVCVGKILSGRRSMRT